jgi:hypothetical protein
VESDESSEEIVIQHVYHTSDYQMHFAVAWCWCRPQQDTEDPFVYVHRFLRQDKHS